MIQPTLSILRNDNSTEAKITNNKETYNLN